MTSFGTTYINTRNIWSSAISRRSPPATAALHPDGRPPAGGWRTCCGPAARSFRRLWRAAAAQPGGAGPLRAGLSMGLAWAAGSDLSSPASVPCGALGRGSPHPPAPEQGPGSGVGVGDPHLPELADQPAGPSSRTSRLPGVRAARIPGVPAVPVDQAAQGLPHIGRVLPRRSGSGGPPGAGKLACFCWWGMGRPSGRRGPTRGEDKGEQGANRTCSSRDRVSQLLRGLPGKAHDHVEVSTMSG